MTVKSYGDSENVCWMEMLRMYNEPKVTLARYTVRATAGKRRYANTLNGSIIQRLKTFAAFFVLRWTDCRVDIRVSSGLIPDFSSIGGVT